MTGGRRFYTAEQMIELRHYLDKNGRSDAKKYVPQRKGFEKLQVIAVVNFKGGSGKTTTTAHLGQHLALTDTARVVDSIRRPRSPRSMDSNRKSIATGHCTTPFGMITSVKPYGKSF